MKEIIGEVRGQVNLSLDEERLEQLKALTNNANYEKEVHFLRQLIGRLADVTEGKPFDLRQLVLSQPAGLKGSTAK